VHSILRSLLVMGVLFAPLAQAADETPPPGGEPPVQQVVVEATRTNVAKLGKEVQMSELRFYELYNTLNKDPDYAITCANEAPTGSRFKRTACQPVFKSKAEQAEARDFIQAFGGGDSAGGTSGGPPHALAPSAPPPVAAGTFAAANMATSAGRPGFAQNIQDVTRRSPELTKLAEEHAALWKRYYTLYRQLNGAPPLPEDRSAGPTGK
jgi:hypothetical protein